MKVLLPSSDTILEIRPHLRRNHRKLAETAADPCGPDTLAQVQGTPPQEVGARGRNLLAGYRHPIEPFVGAADVDEGVPGFVVEDHGGAS